MPRLRQPSINHTEPRTQTINHSGDPEVFQEVNESVTDSLPEQTVIVTDQGKAITVGEIKHSNKIQKSSTPKFTLDWYLKWFASFLILIAMATRGTGLNLYEPMIPILNVRGDEIVISVDLVFSILGTTGWFIVGLIWKDRAVITVNAVGALLLLRTFVENVVVILNGSLL